MAIPLTRANRLVAMRDSDERISYIHIHTLPARPPAFYQELIIRRREYRTAIVPSRKCVWKVT